MILVRLIVLVIVRLINLSITQTRIHMIYIYMIILVYTMITFAGELNITEKKNGDGDFGQFSYLGGGDLELAGAVEKFEFFGDGKKCKLIN